MPSSETSLHWALNRLAAHIPLSCSTSPTTTTENALLATLLHTPLRRGNSKTTSTQTVGPLPALSRQSISACFTAAQRLRDVCAATGRVDYDESKRLVESWDAARAEQARAWAEDAFTSIRAAVASAKSAASVQPRKPAFHHEYTPLLDKYFEFNAYPSAPDRAILARKCMMSPRQIEVWFQNHRNRARKDGKPLRKLTDQSLPPEMTLELSLQSLEKQMPHFTIPVHERQQFKHCDNVLRNTSADSFIPTPVPINAASDIDIASLNPPPPLHAFPTVYSSHDGNTLQAQDRIYTFPAPIWQRKPAYSSPIPKTCIDMNEFILDFNQKLHLRGPVMKTYQPSSQLWYAGRVTIPYRAPHPALVKSPASSTTSYLLGAQTDTFRLLNPIAHTPTLVSPQSGVTCRRRKIADLSKRASSSASTKPRRDSPDMAQASLSPSPSPRSSPFNSNASSPRRLSSSSGSTCSSTLTTPVLSYSVLPEDRCVDLKQDIFGQVPVSSSGEDNLSDLLSIVE